MKDYPNIFSNFRRIWARFCESLINFWQILRDFTNAPNFKKTLLWGIVLYTIALFALIRGDIYYADDLNRAISDYGGNYFSRYLNEFILTNALTLGKGTLDISPLPQILGVVFVVLSAMILLYLIRKKFDFIGILASLPLGLSPHFLQNLSYKFDALTMGIALFLAVFPFLFHTQRRIFCAVSVLSLILMLMTYQAANASYIILSLYFAFFTKANFKAGAKFLALCALNLIIASALYKLTINPVVVSVSDKIFDLNVLFLGVAQNLATYFKMIFSDLKSTAYIWLIAINCALFVANAIFYGNRRIYAFFKAILFLTLGFCASQGLYAILENPLFHPRAYYGLNALVAILAIVNIAESNVFCYSKHSEESQKNNRDSSVASLPQNDKIFLRQILRFFSITSIVVMAYFLISFANIYGNALKKQDEYLAFRAEMLLQDLSDKIPRGATITIDISAMGNAKVTQRFYDKYGFYLVIPQHARRDDFWFNMKLRHLNAPYNFGDAEICDMLKAQFGSEVIAENAHHKIQKAKSCYIIVVR